MVDECYQFSGEATLVRAPEKFRNFRGFHPIWVFERASEREPWEVAREILSELEGHTVQVEFQETNKGFDSNRYSPSDAFIPFYEEFVVSKKRLDAGFLKDVWTDQISIDVVEGIQSGTAYDIQRIVDCGQRITEVSSW